MLASRTPVASWMRSVALSILSALMWRRVTGKFVIDFWNKLANTTSWSEIFLILWTLEYDTTCLSRYVGYRVTRRRKAGNWSQKEWILLQEYKMRTSLCYVIIAVQLLQIRSVYIAVSTDRIWSWIVCLYFVRAKGVGWGIKCSAIFSLYFACTSL